MVGFIYVSIYTTPFHPASSVYFLPRPPLSPPSPTLRDILLMLSLSLIPLTPAPVYPPSPIRSTWPSQLSIPIPHSLSFPLPNKPLLLIDKVYYEAKRATLTATKVSCASAKAPQKARLKKLRFDRKSFPFPRTLERHRLQNANVMHLHLLHGQFFFPW